MLDAIKAFNDYIITKGFKDSTYVEVNFARDKITSARVYEITSDTDNVKEYKDITNGVAIHFREKYNNGVLFEKLLIMETNQPISGYIQVL